MWLNLTRKTLFDINDNFFSISLKMLQNNRKTKSSSIWLNLMRKTLFCPNLTIFLSICLKCLNTIEKLSLAVSGSI